VADGQLTGVAWTLPALRRWWNQNKQEIAHLSLRRLRPGHRPGRNAAINLARLSEHAAGNGALHCPRVGIDLVGVAWWGWHMAAPVAFVGRESELSRLLAALAGDARLVLVVGDAGVGKTRFVAEGMARAAAEGVVVVRGECLPLAEALPLLPVAAAVGELARVDGGALLEAGLAAAPGYVRGEVGRLVPGLGPGGGPGLAGGRDEGWQRQRLFAAVAELLAAVGDATGGRVGLVAEDVHWADGATLDLLTFLTRAGSRGAVSVVATCRGDEAPLDAQVAGWLAQVRAAAGVEEIALGPLSRPEAAQQVAALAGGPAPAEVVEDLYARAEGNPFFTEQLVAAALAGGTGGGLGGTSRLPGRLAELLAARAGRCTGDARAVLAGLAVAGRPLAEEPLGAVTGLGTEAVRGGLRELAAARLLAEGTASEEYRPRHALLAEAVAGGLLPGERAALHESTARALAAAGDQALAGEVAGHWQAASNPAEELPARIAAAEAAERVFGYADAAVHWQRAIELCQAQPGAASAAGTDVPGLYLRAMDAIEWSGDSVRAGLVAAEGYRRFADHPDPATAAVIRHRVTRYGAIEMTDAGSPLIEEALQLFERAPPSAEQAEVWLDYAAFLRSAQGRQDDFLRSAQGRLGGISPALNRALEIADAAAAVSLIPRILASLAEDAFRRGQAEEGFAFLERGWDLAGAADDAVARVRLAGNESAALLARARFQAAEDVALSGIRSARQAGLGASWGVSLLAANACEALLARGCTGAAAALIDPLTLGPPDLDHWLVHEARVEIDLLRGNADAAAERSRLIDAIPGRHGGIDSARESAQKAAELSVWAGRPGDALAEVQKVLPLLKTPDLTILCGRLLATGMRACADLAEQARARRDAPAAEAAVAAAGGLASWSGQVPGPPFADHPFVATIPAERATWDAERARLAGASDPQAWRAAAETWEGLGCPHRAGYARWRQAQAQLDAGQPATAAAGALRVAAIAADGHEPLLAQVRLLAERARIPLQPSAAIPKTPPPAQARVPYGLTGRELAVLRLLAAGRTNAQIGAELYISPRTAGVHVTNILRKLGVSSRVQAAAQAERAGLLPAARP
jgi:DNA-binding CsgD family transcriptional regulator